jgi:hypothetical protein
MLPRRTIQFWAVRINAGGAANSVSREPAPSHRGKPKNGLEIAAAKESSPRRPETTEPAQSTPVEAARIHPLPADTHFADAAGEPGGCPRRLGPRRLGTVNVNGYGYVNGGAEWVSTSFGMLRSGRAWAGRFLAARDLGFSAYGGISSCCEGVSCRRSVGWMLSGLKSAGRVRITIDLSGGSPRATPAQTPE